MKNEKMIKVTKGIKVESDALYMILSDVNKNLNKVMQDLETAYRSLSAENADNTRMELARIAGYFHVTINDANDALHASMRIRKCAESLSKSMLK